jgi:pSer/pThr/pTyr-binding forkhead associated (FHA) protein
VTVDNLRTTTIPRIAMPSDTQHAPSAYAELVVNSDYSHRVRLTADRYIIGRSDDCDILMPEADPSVSRRHAALQRDASGLWWLVDLASRNGTKVGPLRVAPDRPYQLRDGDRFQIGTNEMEFHLTTTPHPLGVPPFVASAPVPDIAPPEPATVRTMPAPTMEISSLQPPAPAPIVINPYSAVEPTMLPGTTEAAARRERTLLPQDTPVPSEAGSAPPVTPVLPATPVASSAPGTPVAIPITPVTPITPIGAGAAIPITPIAALPVTAPVMDEPPRDEDSVYDGPTVNSREIADAYRAGGIVPPGTLSVPPTPPASIPAAPVAPSIASTPSLPVGDGNTVKMRVDWPAANPTQGRRRDSAATDAGGTSASRQGAAYTPPSAVTPPLTFGPGSSLLSRELPSRNAGPSPAVSAPDALSALDNGMPSIAIACGVLMLLSLFLPWAQTKAGIGVTFLPLVNRVGSGLVHGLLFLPALASLAPIAGAFLGRNNRLLALIGGGAMGVVVSTLLLFMKPGSAKGLEFGGTGLFVYVLGALAALGIGVWVRSAGNQE